MIEDEINRVLTLPSFDRHELLKTIDGDGHLFEEIIGVFRKEAAVLISVMDDAVGDENSDGIAKAAHSIKGSALTICAERIARLADILEDLGEDHNVAMAKQVLVHLKAAYEDLEKILDAILPGMGGA
jgi:two-component system, sensor histidine kinase and response regulator